MALNSTTELDAMAAHDAMMEELRRADESRVAAAWKLLRAGGPGELTCRKTPSGSIVYSFAGVDLVTLLESEAHHRLRGHAPWPDGVDVAQWERLACEAMGLSAFGYDAESGMIRVVGDAEVPWYGDLWPAPKVSRILDTSVSLGERSAYTETERVLMRRALAKCERARARCARPADANRVTCWYNECTDELVFSRNGSQFASASRGELATRLATGEQVPNDEMLWAVHDALKAWCSHA